MDMARGAAKLFQEDKGEKIKIKEKQKEEAP
ncbi:MAG: hypothetical protein BWY75_00944 [bacterium ADurb.Bin425]|nr:MAG: hypothetical protein BWY75_00944 [bacterium ADurb.Bin425]